MSYRKWSLLKNFLCTILMGLGLWLVAPQMVEAAVNDYTAPSLNSVRVSGNDYLLDWSQPASNYGTPAGGYDIIIDGVDTGGTNRINQLTTTIGGLTKGVEHCFKIEARWTQANPTVFPRSAQVCAVLEDKPLVYTTPSLESVNFNGNDFILNWSQPESAYGTPAGGYDIIVDGVDTGGTNRTNQITTAISGLNSGEHCFQVEARWTQANPTQFPRSSQVCGLAADTTAPTVSITSPATNSTCTIAETVTIIADAQDETGVTKVEFYDGATLIGSDTTNTYSVSFPVTEADNGTHGITVKAYDAAGNVQSANAINLIVDIPTQPVGNGYSAPVLEWVDVSGSDFSLGWSHPATNQGIPVGGYDIFIDGVDTGGTNRTDQLNTLISGLQPGEHCFEIEARWNQANPAEFPRSNQLCAVLEGSVPPPPSSRPALSMRIDPGFNKNNLPSNARTWYDRLWAGIRNPNQFPNATEMAKSNNTYNYGRHLNMHMTSLMQVLRVTGDPALFEEIDRLAQLMRAELQDLSITSYQGSVYEADGYLNWQYDYDAGYGGTDVHVMDEMMTHSNVAAFAYAYYVNRDLDSRYAERASFWTDYLKNHFEAKWRMRERKASGFPFLTKKLAHPYIQWIRYHYFMSELTGDQAYYNEAVRMAGVMDRQVTQTNTPLGVAAQWNHGMTELGESSMGAQRMNYARYTVQAAADLALEDFNVFGQAGFMDKMALTIGNFIMDSSAPSSFAYRIDGTSSPRETDDRYAISAYTQLGRWDSSGRVLSISDQVCRGVESNMENPRYIHIPAGMVFSLLK